MKKILINNEAELRLPNEKVTLKKGLEISRELFKVLNQWNKDHPKHPGIGLAAPQLGIHATVCVLKLPGTEIALVNPVIVAKSEAVVNYQEGCLSFPGKLVTTQRPVWIKVTCDNLKEEHVFGIDLSKVTGKTYEQMILECVCVCHEIDHCSSILIMDRAVK